MTFSMEDDMKVGQITDNLPEILERVLKMDVLPSSGHSETNRWNRF